MAKKNPSLTAPYFHDDDKAREYLESIRWEHGPVCPHCGAEGGDAIKTGKDTVRKDGRIQKARKGLYRCPQKECREQFSVTVGTVFERSHIPLSKWLMAAYLLCSSKKGISSHQLHRTLDVTYKTAWFLSHRIRHAMASPAGLMGAGGNIVEADETYIGNKKAPRLGKRAGHGHKHTVFALVERGGQVHSTYIPTERKGGTAAKIAKAIAAATSPEARMMTDDARWYRNIMKPYASHETVNHSKGEYVRGDVHTNTIEGVFSIFKRGMIGTYQHCGEQHLQRYLTEFDFRYNHRAALGTDDNQRTIDVLKGISGKRLTYRKLG
jgi:transposase-like protein